MKKSLVIIIFLIAVIALYALWSSGKLPWQPAQKDALAPITATDTTGDIEEDLNNLTITEEDTGFNEINSDLNSL